MEAAIAEIDRWPDKRVQVLHHNDADGLSSGAILTRAFERRGYAVRRVCLEKPYPIVLERIFEQRDRLIVLTDFAGRISPATGQEALRQLAARQEAVRRGIEEIAGELQRDREPSQWRPQLVGHVPEQPALRADQRFEPVGRAEQAGGHEVGTSHGAECFLLDPASPGVSRPPVEPPPKAPPSASDPVSPMNTAAGGALYHKKPRPPPISPAVKIRISPVPGT